jgi:cobalt/nickel transport system ATP-binding protein
LLKDIGGTQLLATHDLELARELCTRAIVLEKGRVLAEGEPGSLLRDKAFLQAHGLA